MNTRFNTNKFRDLKIMVRGMFLAFVLMGVIFVWTHRQAYIIATFHSDVVSSLKITQPVVEIKK